MLATSYRAVGNGPRIMLNDNILEKMFGLYVTFSTNCSLIVATVLDIFRLSNSVCFTVCVCVYQSIFLSACLPHSCRSVCLSIHLFCCLVCLYACLSVCLSVSQLTVVRSAINLNGLPAFCLPIRLSIFLFICFCLSVCLTAVGRSCSVSVS